MLSSYYFIPNHFLRSFFILKIKIKDNKFLFPFDQIHNDDGVWLRLNAETIKEYCNSSHLEAWCLQYNQHLGKTLLLPVEEPKSILDQVIKETILRKRPDTSEEYVKIIISVIHF